MFEKKGERNREQVSSGKEIDFLENSGYINAYLCSCFAICKYNATNC